MKDLLLIRVIHVAMFSTESSSGPSLSVTALSQAQSKLEGVRASVLNLYGVEAPIELVLSEACVEGRVLVVFHGVWVSCFWAVAAALRRHKIPYIVTPRSNLVVRAIRKSWWKKVPALFFSVVWFVRGSLGIHFLGPSEQSRSLTFGRRFFTAPNGFDAPLFGSASSSGSEFISRGDMAFSRTLLFLGRLDSYHKGLDLLVEAIGLERHLFITHKIGVLIVGDDIRGDVRSLRRLIRMYGLCDVVRVVPQRVVGAEKDWLLRSVDGFVHTSRYEGEPLAVIEALFYGLPVLVTEESNLGGLVNDYCCGIVSTTDISMLRRTLTCYVQDFLIPQVRVSEAPLVGRDWATVAATTIAGYRAMLDETDT